MTGPSVEEIFSDVVIIGSGVAGLLLLARGHFLPQS